MVSQKMNLQMECQNMIRISAENQILPGKTAYPLSKLKNDLRVLINFFIQLIFS